MSFFNRTLISLLCLFSALSPSVAAPLQQSPFYANGAYYQLDNKQVMGRIENIYYANIAQLHGVAVPAKIDTGADTTSIHALNIHVQSQHPQLKHLHDEALLKAIAEHFGDPSTEWWLDSFDTPERNIQASVSFDLVHPQTGKLIPVQRPLARISGIQGRGEHGILYRPVVELLLSSGELKVTTAVNLTDRSTFSYPILIGKTFLKNHAWVDSSYNYLQQEAQASVLGSKETAYLGKQALAVSFSFYYRRSSLDARNIEVDLKRQQVSFDVITPQQRQRLSAPLLRMLKIGENQQPVVNLTLDFGQTSKSIELVLRDRSAFSSQLRLGTEALNQHFMIDLSANYLSEQGLSKAIDYHPKALMMSPNEEIKLEGVDFSATPSLAVKTSLMRVKRLKTLERSGHAKSIAAFSATDKQGKTFVFEQDIQRNITVGEQTRPIISPILKLGERTLQADIALEQTTADKPETLLIGERFVDGPLLINTRTENIFNKTPPIKAGYVEQAQVEGIAIAVKLDTGADLSSMHAEDIEYFDKQGKPWVKFTYRNKAGVEQQFTREVVGRMVIKARVGETADSRPVVEMQAKLGELSKRIRVNLQNRANFNYSMILGKNFLRHGVLVSSDAPYLLTKPLH
ncbi:RimK/LysX family protein [Agarivorans sp.]|uniref:putative ATP-dependent zinc protease n=1 Tax=Agarivorans sp. TaxID=1872412 RepID=UPI003D05DF5C